MLKSTLEYNILVHNRIAKKYERIHGEIYNDVEQARLKESLGSALSMIATGSSPLKVIDFGCGAGNLTQHLTDLGCEVMAADVSEGFLDLVASREYSKNVLTFKLNGIDLEGIKDESVDMVAMYSVLHHVPDYLSLMKEFSRVLKKGGILYIDHEMSPAVWSDPNFNLFKKEIKKHSRVDIGKYFIFTNYIDRFIRMFINPTYQREGDIHVFKDDHIEWDRIVSTLTDFNMRIMAEKDYLHFKRNYDLITYETWQRRIGDMRILMAQKA